MNKDLPREEQLRIVLQNYDRKVAECSALKEENEKLRKQLQQKDILYRNMLNRFKGGKKGSAEAANKELEIANNKLKEDNKRLKKEADNVRRDNCRLLKGLKGMKGILKTANYQLDGMRNRLLEEYYDELPENKPVVENVPQAYQDFKQSKFYKYVCDVVDTYKKTGSLRGIATKAKEYEVRAMTKEQFFQLGLNNVSEVTDEYVNGIYLQAKKH